MSENDIVISGMSGRFPESRNVEEFSNNLYAGVDMVTTSEDRWPEGVYGFCNRMGRIPDFDLFDGQYFGLMEQMVKSVEPQARILLETTYEAIIDSGINPQQLRGTRTGVYVGLSPYSMSEGYPELMQPDLAKTTGEEFLFFMGHLKSLFSSRISFAFDFKGPSLVTDTACSASLSAFYLAMNDLRLGHCDYAIVCGTHMTLQPSILQMQQGIGISSPTGRSAVLDNSADGFVKGDAVASLLLQKRYTAKRVYATVLSSRVNIDGKKKVGMFFPSSEAQESLMTMAYKDAGIDPLKLTYFEAHCTGTKAGDPQEVKAIYNAYCANPGRSEPLPMGLLKSNIGHTEGASGVCSVIKVILSYENESIPPNINLKQIKDECKEYCPPLYPNTEILKYKPGLAAINNFGIGGANVNVLVEPNYKLSNEDNLKIAENIPRIVNICGRTEEAVKYVFDFIENNPQKITRDFLALIADTMKGVPDINSAGLPYRGSIIIKKLSEDESGIKYEYKKQISTLKSKTVKQIWFLFPGLGGQWPAMAKALMPIKTFADKVEECHQILSEFGVNLKHLMLSEDKNAVSTMTAKFCATTCIELALFEVLKSMDITPDGFIGHSFGEIACAYADGCLTTKEAMIITYVRGVVTESDKKIIKGLMAVCSLTKAEAKKLIPPEVVIACYNAKNTVVISGPEKPIKEVMDKLNEKNIFVHQLESSGIPFHSHYLLTSAEQMTNKIKKYLPTPIKRSKKWISTSILEAEPKDETLKYASAEYFVNNLISPVYFYDKLKERLPSDAIIIEIGPHGIFRKIVTETLGTASYVSLIKKDSNDTNLDLFFSGIATLYELGVNPSIENLYPKIEWPVSRGTPSIGSLMKWDHNIKYECRLYPNHFNRITASDMNVSIDLLNMEENFYAGHCIDGNILFPATGYLMFAWRQFAGALGKTWDQVPVVFENVQFRRAVFMSEENKTKLKVRYNPNSDDFYVLENDNLCATGKVRSPTDDSLLAQQLIHEKQNCILENEWSLESEDIYKELRVTGYDYSGEFQRLKKVRTNNFTEILGICEWNGNLITFLDALLQTMIFAAPFKKLMVPVMFNSIRIDPKVLFESITHNKLTEHNKEITLEDVKKDVTRELINEEMLENITKQEKLDMGMGDTQLERVNKQYFRFKSNMPFYFNAETKMLITYGIEIENVLAFPIPRRVDTTNLVLDSYEFVANEDNSAIDSCDRKDITQYLELCKSMAAKLKQMGLKDIKCDFNYQNLSDNLVKDFRHQNNGNHIMFKILDKIYESAIDENENLSPDRVKSFVKELRNNKEFDSEKDLVNIVSKNQRLIRTLTDIVSENYVPKKELKVTEINLSSDILAKEVELNMANFQVIPTDVDYKLIVKSNEGINENFIEKSKVWDISQELSLEASDLIILRDTHEIWQLNLDNLIGNLKENINDNGFLLTVCRNRYPEPEIALNSILNDKIIFNNSDLEKRIEDIIKSCKSKGLQMICNKCDSIGTKALLFRKIEEIKKIPENNQIIEITAERNEKWFELIKEKMLFAKDADNKTDDVWLIARDTHINGIIGLINCLRLEPGGENIKCIFDFDHSIKLPIDWNSKPFSDILTNNLVNNVIKDGKLGTYRHLKLAKDFDKIVSDDYYLNISQTRDLASLQWFDARSIVPNKEFYDMNNIRITQVPINIYSSGLTFHDVMVATGRMPSGPQLLFTDCLIGCEFSGRRADTGERVMGFEMTRCFASSIDADVKMLSPIPEHWSMDDAITILSTYSTVWYGLIDKAGLKQGESILIHSGAGGVGQSAINVCKHFKCDIYVTVGTEEKKQFIIKEYNIPENKIFSSRDIQFKYKIKELTKGKGVDIVLNSLAGEKLDAGYKCLANGGRFVELGRFDSFQNKQLGMFDFLRDISYIGVVLEMGLIDKQDFAIRFFDWMHKNCNNGCVKPFNKVVFNANEAEKAFRYMTTGKHIGKIVIRIREEEPNRKPLKVITSAPNMLTTSKVYFDPNKVYIITGGLGGIGMELIHWMIYMGARKFVLTSRSGLKTDYQKYVINRLIKFGENFKIFNIKIVISENDCFTTESTRRVLSDASQFGGQIGGIFHLSIVLNDCLLENLSYDKFCQSIDTKYKVFNNLDVETRKLSYNLDFFVVFSSITCGKGNAGQSNYSFGNSLCERICEQRRKDGLHGLAIQYGPVGDVGVYESSEQLLQLSTLQKQRINSCCDVLDKLLSVRQPIVTSHIKSERVVQSGGRQKRMIKELWKALGIDPETTPDHVTLGEIGIESMFAVELQQELEREYNVKISINHIKNIDVGMLKDYEAGRVDNIKKYLDELKQAKTVLSKYKFIIPSEPFTRLNDVKNGKPIYFMPPIEITYSAYEEMAKKFDRPVIGINWTKDMNKFESIKEFTNYIMDLFKKLEPNGKLDLVGYFEGTLAVSKLLLKGMVRKAVVIDIISDKRFKEKYVSDEYLNDFLFECFAGDLPSAFKDKLHRELKKESDLNSKVRKIVSEMKDFVGRAMIANDLEETLHILMKRTRILSKYRTQKMEKFSNKLKEKVGKKWAKKTGKLVIIKPLNFANVEDIDEETEGTRDTYLLPEENESKEIISIEGIDSVNIFCINTELVVNKIIESFK